jgi:cyclin T
MNHHERIPSNPASQCLFTFSLSKVEEQPRKLEHVIKILNICLDRVDHSRESYAEQSQELVFNENVLLQTLGFDVAIDHP